MPDAESKGALKEVGEGFKAILERIADFFDIFDLSFIVSGATSAAAIAFWGWRAQIQIPSLPQNWITGVGLVIGSYVLGLVCFALGRWVRMGCRWRDAENSFYTQFLGVLRGHGLATELPFSEYLARLSDRGDWRLYVRLWAEVRDSPSLPSSFSLLRRYWVMAATYDGLAIALMLWALAFLACAFGVGGANLIDGWMAYPTTAVLVVASVACIREANRYVDYQIEELVASVAAIRGRRAPESR